MLLKISRVGLSLLIMTAGGLLLVLLVHRPYQQNVLLRPLIHHPAQGSPAVARRYQNQLTALAPWDPYLDGFRRVASSRLAADANEFEVGLGLYEAAASSRVPPRFRIEAGLYMMAHGRYDKGIELIMKAVETDPRLIDEIPNPNLRAQIRTIVEKVE